MKKLATICLIVLLLIVFECTLVYARSLESNYPFIDEPWPENNTSNHVHFICASRSGVNVTEKFGGPDFNGGINLFINSNGFGPGVYLEKNIKLSDYFQIKLGGNLIYELENSWITGLGRARVEISPVKFLSLYYQHNSFFKFNNTYGGTGGDIKFGAKADMNSIYIKLDLLPYIYVNFAQMQRYTKYNIVGDLGLKLDQLTLIGRIYTNGPNYYGLYYGFAMAF